MPPSITHLLPLMAINVFFVASTMLFNLRPICFLAKKGVVGEGAQSGG